MTDKQRHILKQFPEKSHTITHLMDEDPEFRGLCEDYDVCVKALRHWEKSKEPEAKTRVDEYRILVKELEGEIRAALESKRLD